MTTLDKEAEKRQSAIETFSSEAKKRQESHEMVIRVCNQLTAVLKNETNDRINYVEKTIHADRKRNIEVIRYLKKISKNGKNKGLRKIFSFLLSEEQPYVQ